MALYAMKTTDFSFTDHRGSLIQLVHYGYSQVNVLSTNGGVLRGGHYHRKCHEAFYVISGSVETTLRAVGGTEKETAVFSQGDFFEIFPGVVHSMYFNEDCLMVQMYDVPVESAGGEKDIVQEEI